MPAARLVALMSVAALAAAWAGVAPVTAAPPVAPTVAGLGPVDVQGFADLGPVAADAPVAMTLALALRDRPGLEARVGELLAGGGGEMGDAEVVARHAPDPATVATVAGWARAAGLEVVSVSANRTLVRVRGPASRVGRALGVGLRLRRAGGLDYRSVDRPVTLPPVLAGRVDAVLGLSDLGAHKGMRPRRSAGPALPPAGIGSLHAPRGPADFMTFYHAPEASRGQGQSLVILAAGDLTIPQRDLVVFEQTYGLPRVPWTTVRIGATTGSNIDDLEWDLDTQYATAFAPAVSSLIVYDTPALDDPDSITELNRWITDSRAREASFSVGECEDVAVRTGFQRAADTELLQAVAEGKTLFAPSGDTGSFCPKLVDLNDIGQSTRPQATYPGASPYAVSVGGTTLTEGPQGLREVAWHDGGGGMATSEAQPPHQAGAGGTLQPGRRGTPDVSLDADPDTGYSIIENGRTLIVGGTSAGAPAWLGIWARAQAEHGGRLGFAAPILYRLPAAVFNDVVVGFQGLWPASPGWDYTTGRGTPDIAGLLAAIR